MLYSGSHLINCFINDIFHFLDKSSLRNYSDNNTLSYGHSNSDNVIHTLLRACTSTLQWFKINQMKANPTKMQAISYDKRGTREIIDVTFENTTIHFDNSVVLLGIEIDHSQTFNKHFTNMCKTTARQLAIFKRISHIFTRHGKIFKLFTAITQPRTTSC